MAIRQNLNFNVPGLGDEFFDENPVISKAAGRFILGRLETLARLRIITCDAHALATATGAGFEHHRISDLLGDLHRLIGVSDQTHIARDCAYPSFLRQFFRGDFVSHAFNRRGGGANKSHAFSLQCLSKQSIFGQKPVAGMHRLRPSLPDRLHDFFNHDVRLIRG